MVYTIGVGKYREDWKTHNMEFDGQIYRIPYLNLETVEQAKEIIRIAKITCYRIYEQENEDACNGKVIEETKDIINFNSKIEQEREKFLQSQYAKVIRINKLPAEEVVISNDKVIVKLIRTEATFNPKRSLKIAYGVYVFVEQRKPAETKDSYSVQERINKSEIMLGYYVTSSNKLLRNKFKKNELEYRNLTEADVRLEDLVLAKRAFEKEIANA